MRASIPRKPQLTLWGAIRWCRFKDETRSLESVGFIDGSFVERWVDLTPQQMEEVLAGQSEAQRLALTASGVSALVDELARLH